MEDHNFKFEISLSVLNHLGRNLYRNFITVLGEAISNSWDADAQNVWITIDKPNGSFTVVDDGKGMDAASFQDRFLKIGYSKRKEGGNSTGSGRPFIGAKGIGKLALLSCAKVVTIVSKTAGSSPIGGRIDNRGLDEAITNNLTPDEYPLETPAAEISSPYFEAAKSGTLILFEQSDALNRVSPDQIRTLIAMNFRFSLIEKSFKIWVDDVPVDFTDLTALANATQMLWPIKDFSDDFLALCKNVKRTTPAPDTALNIKGYLATVEKPSFLKVRGANNDERATVDLFVNGRLREKNLLRHIPSQRIVESYLYGQIHFDEMDGDGDSPFTSSREGVIENNAAYSSLIDYLKREMVPQIIADWDKFRGELRQIGDVQNLEGREKRKRLAADFVNSAEEEFLPREATQEKKDQVDSWLAALRPDAEFNLDAYINCFLAENLIRKYISETGKIIPKAIAGAPSKYKNQEVSTKSVANISFQIRKNATDSSYLGIKDLAHWAEGKLSNDQQPSLTKDALTYTPVRDAVGHTGLLTQHAKMHLEVTFENIKARIRTIISS